MKTLYFIQVPGIMGGYFKKLTKKEAEQLRIKGYTVSK